MGDEFEMLLVKVEVPRRMKNSSLCMNFGSSKKCPEMDAVSWLPTSAEGALLTLDTVATCALIMALLCTLFAQQSSMHGPFLGGQGAIKKVPQRY